MTKQPHANNPNATSNNDPAGNTFGEFLSAPMATKADQDALDAALDTAQAALHAALDAHFTR